MSAIRTPPVIRNAGRVTPNNRKITWPRMMNTTTMRNVATIAFVATFFCTSLSSSPVRDRKIGVFARGFITAKRPAKADSA